MKIDVYLKFGEIENFSVIECSDKEQAFTS